MGTDTIGSSKPKNILLQVAYHRYTNGDQNPGRGAAEGDWEDEEVKGRTGIEEEEEVWGMEIK